MAVLQSRTERHGDGGAADLVVHDLVPDQDLQRVGAYLATDLQGDHRLGGPTSARVYTLLAWPR